MKERHPRVKRRVLEVPDAGPISNTAGVHPALLRHYGELTQQICFTYHWINKTLILCVLQFSFCFMLQIKSLTAMKLLYILMREAFSALGALCDLPLVVWDLVHSTHLLSLVCVSTGNRCYIEKESGGK